MTDLNSTVFVIDDDVSVRESVGNLLKSVGLRAEVFGSTEQFMSVKRSEMPGCLVLDVRLPGVSGLEFQDALEKAGIHIPIVFITGHGDIPMTLRALKAGAVEFLAKPFQKQELLSAIDQALEQDRTRREEESELASLLNAINEALANPTPRRAACGNDDSNLQAVLDVYRKSTGG